YFVQLRIAKVQTDDYKRNRQHLLVIDDSPFIFKAVKAIEPHGFQVVDNAANGKVGLEMYKKYNPDIVTLDVTMPVMDGIETARELFKINPNAKIIMLSAMGDEALINQAKEIGIKHFLTKPFKADELLQLVKALFKGVLKWMKKN
ncbi:MAG: response regulator, partial [Desulfosudis oleivorans]|nr:response regulator [Desulfosudis oleivorans]